MKATYIFLIGLMLTAGTAIAQPPKTYAETKREQDWKKYQDDYNAGNSGSSTTTTSSGNVDKNAADQLADQWRRNAGKRTAAEQQAWEAGAAERDRKAKAAEEKKRNDDAQFWAKAEVWRVEREEREKARAPEVKKRTEEALALGFRYEEADRFARVLVPYPNKQYEYPSDEVYRGAVNEAMLTKKNFDAGKNKLSFDELATMVRKMRIGSLTAMASWQFLGERFPEYKEFTEKEEFYTLRAILDVNSYQNDAVAKEQKIALDRFWILYEKYPSEAIYSMRIHSIQTSPFVSRGCANPANGFIIPDRKWCELFLLSPLTSEEYRQKQYRYNMFWGSTNAKLWKAKTVEYWKDMATLADILQVNVFERYAYLKDNTLKKGTGVWGSGYFAYELNPDYAVLLNEMEEVANAGDASVMNAYGLQLAAGKNSSSKERKRGFQFLKKAADTGSMWALLNLLFCADAGVSGAPTAAAAMDDLRTVLSKTTAAKKYAANQIIMDMIIDGTINPKHADYAFELCQQAAAEGYAAAITSVQSPAWAYWGKMPVVKFPSVEKNKYASLTVPGQTVLFNNWTSSMKALKWSGLETMLTDKSTYRYFDQDKLVMMNKINQMSWFMQPVGLTTEEPVNYTFKASVEMQKSGEQNATGIAIRGKYARNPILTFCISPSLQYYQISCYDELTKKWTLLNSNVKVYPNSFSAAVHKYDKDNWSKNELAIEKKGEEVLFSINGTIVDRVKVAAYPSILKAMTTIGIVTTGGSFTSMISNIFFSVTQ